MVAYKPRTPSDRLRLLSPEITERLRAALAARWEGPSDSDAELTSALCDAAREAKQRQLRPEELLLALKALEERVADSLKRVDSDARDDLRHWLVGACMRAYFGDASETDQ